MGVAMSTRQRMELRFVVSAHIEIKKDDQISYSRQGEAWTGKARPGGAWRGRARKQI